MSDWFENEDLFLRQLQTGHDYAVLAAAALSGSGLAVRVTPMEVRDDIDDRHRFADEFDLLVGHRRPARIDVKSRNLRFTTVDDYPYDSAFVDTVSGWKAKSKRPLAIILVSQVTRSLLVVPVSTEDTWWIERRFDRDRKIDDDFYMIDTNRLRPFNELVDWLRKREN